MKVRYVVGVKPPDDHPGAVRVFGLYHDRATAEHWCNLVRQSVDAAQIADETTGYAYVFEIERPSLRIAAPWARRGERVKS